jgi:hypothetical protein
VATYPPKTVVKVSDDQLAAWTKPAFGNEEKKAETTERMIREAVCEHALLKTLDVRVFAKGSFKNNTNVRRDSDVDVAVEYRGMITTQFAEGASFEGLGLSHYSGTFKDTGKGAFKAAVGEAMRKAFGSSAVDDSGNKVFKVRESSRSLAADVVPCTTYRYYWPSGTYRQGIELILNRPNLTRKVNYPEQHYANGVGKNTHTSKRFKRTVRILKNIEGKLVEAGQIAEVPSYFVECLAYNVPDHVYNGPTTWRGIVLDVTAEIWRYAKEPEPTTDRWVEVNEGKYLFHSGQRWTHQDAVAFSLLAWRMVQA